MDASGNLHSLVRMALQLHACSRKRYGVVTFVRKWCQRMGLFGETGMAARAIVVFMHGTVQLRSIDGDSTLSGTYPDVFFMATQAVVVIALRSFYRSDALY